MASMLQMWCGSNASKNQKKYLIALIISFCMVFILQEEELHIKLFEIHNRCGQGI
jgi:hypothetical protein